MYTSTNPPRNGGTSANVASAHEASGVAATVSVAGGTTIYIMDPFRRLIRRPDGTWYDTGAPNSPVETSLKLMPGQAYYYIRRGAGADLDF